MAIKKKTSLNQKQQNKNLQNQFATNEANRRASASQNQVDQTKEAAKSFQVKEVIDNPDGSTTLRYADNTTKNLTREQENARNIAVAGKAGLGFKKQPGTTTEDIRGAEANIAQGEQQMQAQKEARFQQIAAEQTALTNQQLGGVQEEGVDIGQAVTAGFANVLPSTIGGAVGVGAVAGVASGGTLAVPGAIAGGIGGFVTGFFNGVKNNIKSQQGGEIAATKDTLSAAKRNIRALTLLAAKDPSKAEEALTLYYQQLGNVRLAQRKLQLETQGNLNKFMNDGTQDLSDFQLYLEENGEADLALMKLQLIIGSGQPASDAELMQLYQDMQND
jgi:hypothetical protein